MRLRDPPANGCIDQLLFREIIAATVFLENQGLGAHPGIVSIVGDHIESALDVIPRTGVSFKIL